MCQFSGHGQDSSGTEVPSLETPGRNKMPTRGHAKAPYHYFMPWEAYYTTNYSMQYTVLVVLHVQAR